LSKEDTLYLYIGRFIAEFSELEFTLRSKIATAIHLSQEDTDVILTHDFAMLCTIAQKILTRGKDKEQVAKIKSVIVRCRALNDARVRIAHGYWRVGHPMAKLIHSSRQKLEPVAHFRDVDEIVALVDEAGQLGLLFFDIGQ
jgi:hypothetical protein